MTRRVENSLSPDVMLSAEWRALSRCDDYVANAGYILYNERGASGCRSAIIHVCTPVSVGIEGVFRAGFRVLQSGLVLGGVVLLTGR
ncbi:hypothetical protein EMIT0P12_40300 [Pseudomonas sp. IT-P12]